MNLSNASRSQLSRIPGLNRAIDFICARANVVFGAQHNNETGVHTAITADSIAVTGDATVGGSGAFGADVVARSGSGVETAIGQLTTVNGASLLAALGTRSAVLIGGVTSGYVLVKRDKSGAFGGAGTYELAIYDLAESTANAMLQIAKDNGNYSLIDGGTGSTSVRIGSANRPMLEVIAADLIADRLQLTDGITAPAATAGKAKIYVDTADGDLKVIFGDGTIKTIVTD